MHSAIFALVLGMRGHIRAALSGTIEYEYEYMGHCKILHITMSWSIGGCTPDQLYWKTFPNPPVLATPHIIYYGHVCPMLV